MNISDQIPKYINYQNRQIWEEIKLHYNFILTYNPLEKSWSCTTEDLIAEIITPTKEIDYEAFTHELLHIYLDFLGLSKYPDFIYNIMGENSFGILVVESSLISALYNFCSHKKMYPYFKQMGFSEYRFVNARIYFNDLDLNYIRNGFLSNGKQSKYIDQFIGHTLSMMNNVVEEDKVHCEKYLQKLKEVDEELYRIVEEFDREWEYSKDLDLLSIFLIFEKKLDDWLIMRNLTFENDYYK